MLLDLTRYRQPVSRFARTLQPGEIGDQEEAYRIVAPVELAFEIHKDKERFRLVGTVRTELELACSRCLEPFGLPVDAPFDLRFLPFSEASLEAEREMAEEDLETSYYRDDEIDLDGLLRGQFYLALPMKPLCRAECRGLCAQCGTNLNADSCTCEPVWEEPRLAALKGLVRTRES